MRRRGIPCRYVSGYLFHGSGDTSADGATHAWVEALLPGLGWVGFDPTNNVLAGTRHIRVAIGRDYADVPPTKGVFRGRSANELAVAVQVSQADTAVLTRELMPVMTLDDARSRRGQPTGTSISAAAAAAAAVESRVAARSAAAAACVDALLLGLLVCAPRSHARRGRP